MISYLGYDPGAIGKHGVACVAMKPSGPCCTIALDTVHSADEALAWITDHIRRADTRGGIGICAPTEWNLGPAGVRAADRYLLKSHSSAKVMPPYRLDTSLTLGGMAMLVKLRERWCDLPVTEVRPDLLYASMSGRAYDFATLDGDMCRWITRRTDIIRLIEDDGYYPWDETQWRALFAAWVCSQGIERWLDLHDLPPDGAPGLVVRPAGRTKFVWPPSPARTTGARP